MTGGDLYRMLGDMLAQPRKPEELVEILYTTTSVSTYA